MTDNGSNIMDLFTYSLLIGIGATAVMDIWGLLLRVFLGIPSLNFSMVGRWIGHIPKGQLFHQGIAKSESIIGEAIIGWTFHYLTGIIFATLLLVFSGIGWVNNPTILPALMVGIATVVFPFFIMQPCFGAGIASRHLPNPNIARLKSLTTHLVFGSGLYLSALFLQSMEKFVT